MFSFTELFDVSAASKFKSYRSSSYDRNGGNADFRRIMPGESIPILEAEGSGIVTHIWFALNHLDQYYMRALVIRAWWDGEKEPSVNCPLGDFFGVGHAITQKYECAVMNMVRGTGERGEG